MENPFKSITPKEWLYIAGAVASLGALAWALGKGRTYLPTGTQTDVPNVVVSSGPGYTGYNMPPANPMAITSPSMDQTQASGNPCCCDMGCAGPSQLDNGSAYSGLNGLLAYYQSTNPYYIDLYAEQLKLYSAYFATGESYSRAGVSLGVSGQPQGV